MDTDLKVVRRWGGAILALGVLFYVGSMVVSLIMYPHVAVYLLNLVLTELLGWTIVVVIVLLVAGWLFGAAIVSFLGKAFLGLMAITASALKLGATMRPRRQPRDPEELVIPLHRFRLDTGDPAPVPCVLRGELDGVNLRAGDHIVAHGRRRGDGVMVVRRADLRAGEYDDSIVGTIVPRTPVRVVTRRVIDVALAALGVALILYTTYLWLRP